MSEEGNEPSPPRSFTRNTAYLWLAGILAVGLFLRVWGLGKESAWWDEYSSLIHLSEPTLSKFLSANRTYDPATLPLYYAIEYLWARLAGVDTLLMRVPSLLMGLATIGATFALGRQLFTSRAGLLAAACVAFSPVHIFHSQGIRMYVLFTLLAVLTMLAYMRMRRTGENRSLAIQALMQFTLSWTHPFAVFIPVVQGLSWLMEPSSRRAGIFRWGLTTALAWSPALLYLSTVRYYPQEMTNWIVVPNFQELFHDLFQDDLPRTGYALHISERAWNWLPFGVGMLLLRSAILWEVALTLVMVGSLLIFSAQALRDRIRAHSITASNRALLVIWSVAPVLMLYVASLAIRPMIAPRYTVHSSIAFYLMIAGLVSMAPKRWRFPAEVLVGLLMLSQAGLIYPGPQRTDYIGAAGFIAENANPERDTILITSSFERSLFDYNAEFDNMITLDVEGTIPAYLMAAVSLLSDPNTDASAWILHVIPYWPKHPDPFPEEFFPPMGLDYEVHLLSAIQDIRIVRVSRGEAELDHDRIIEEIDRWKNLVPKPTLDWRKEISNYYHRVSPQRVAGLMREFCMLSQVLGGGSFSQQCGTFDLMHPMPDNRAGAMALLIPFEIEDEDRELDDIAISIDKAIELDPNFGMARLFAGIVAGMKGDRESARSQLAAACAVDPSVDSMIGEYVRAIQDEDRKAAEEALIQMRVSADGLVETFEGLLPVLLPSMDEGNE